MESHRRRIKTARSTPLAPIRPDDIVVPDTPVLVARFVFSAVRAEYLLKTKEADGLHLVPNGNVRAP